MAKEAMTESGLSPEEKAKVTEKQTEATETTPAQETKRKEKKADKEALAKQENAGQENRQEKVEKSKGLPAFLESYRKAYPKEKAFHVTTDNQVFLEKDLNLARLHQRGLKNGELQTIKVK